MPRLKNGTPNYCKHKASGQAVVTLNGRDFYLGKHGTAASRREYERRIGQWLASGRTLTDEAQNVTITEVMVDYVNRAREDYQKNGKPTSEVATVRIVAKALRLMYGASGWGPCRQRIRCHRLQGLPAA